MNVSENFLNLSPIVSNEDLFFSEKETHLKRRFNEMVLHEQCWLLLTDFNPD
jgi:hypothetical protein